MVLSARSLLLLLCTALTFVVAGRAPGAVNLRTREIEMSITAERKSSRERGSTLVWLGATRAG